MAELIPPQEYEPLVSMTIKGDEIESLYPILEKRELHTLLIAFDHVSPNSAARFELTVRQFRELEKACSEMFSKTDTPAINFPNLWSELNDGRIGLLLYERLQSEFGSHWDPGRSD